MRSRSSSRIDSLMRELVDAYHEAEIVKSGLKDFESSCKKIMGSLAFEDLERAQSYMDMVCWKREAEKKVADLSNDLVISGFPTGIYVRCGEFAIRIVDGGSQYNAYVRRWED